MITERIENKANRGRKVRNFYASYQSTCGQYSETRTRTLNQKKSDKPIGRINPELENMSILL